MPTKKNIKEDYINLSFPDIFNYFWKDKVFYLFFIIVFVVLGQLTYNSKSKEFSSKIEVLPLSKDLQNSLSLINNFNLFNVYLSESEKKQDTTNTFNVEVTEYELLDLFISKLKFSSYLEDSLIKNEYLPRENFANEEDYISAIKKLTSQIIIKAPHNSDEIKKIGNIVNIRKNWEIIFDGNDLIKYKKVLNDTQLKINGEIKSYLINSWEILFKDLKFLLNSQIDLIDLKIKNEKKVEGLKNQFYLSKIIEQFKIAKEINLSENIYLNSNLQYNQSYSLEKNYNIFDEEILNSYLEGYIALEKKIELIKERDEENFLNDKMLELINDKNDLTIQFDQLNLLDGILLNSYIYEDDFKAINFDINNLNHVKKHNYYKVIIIYFILGFLLALLLKSLYYLINKNKNLLPINKI